MYASRARRAERLHILLALLMFREGTAEFVHSVGFALNVEAYYELLL